MESKDRKLALVKKETDLLTDVGREKPMTLATGSEAVSHLADILIRLTASQRTFLRMRYFYDSDNECARACGISVNTLQAWKKTKGFGTAYRELLVEPLMHARANLVVLSNMATGVLEEAMQAGNPMPTRVDAAKAVMKGRDVQLLTNNVKVETQDQDLYSALMARLAQAKVSPPQVRVVEEEPRDEDAVEAEFSEVPEQAPAAGQPGADAPV